MHLSDYILTLKEKGEFCFTSQQTLKILNISEDAFRMSLMRLRRKKIIITLHKRFHLIISPEYHSVGCLPPNHFISAYMKFLGLPYYVCLLSAAGYYGASHQKPQIFQVMTNKQLRSIKCGKVVVQFIFKKDFHDIPINTFNVPTGYIKVSTLEITIMDLLKYQKRSGGINHIATVLTELIVNVNPRRLLQLANNDNEIAWVQKLGYILEQLDPIETEHWEKTIKLLKNFIKEKHPMYVPLVSNGFGDGVKNTDWKVIVNYKIESDI